MHAVVNRIRLSQAIGDDVYAAARGELPERVAAIQGIHAFYVVRCGESDMFVVILADSQEAIDRMREDLGNDWMRANVLPHAAAAPERLPGEVVVAFERDPRG